MDLSVTTRRRWSLLLVLLLAAIAGCGGVVSDQSSTSTQTMTPAPVPTVPSDGPAGVAADGVNVTAVVGTHDRQLLNSSYTLQRTLTVRSVMNDSLRYRERTVTRVAAGGQPYTMTTTYSDPRHFDQLLTDELYYDGVTTRRSTFANDDVSYTTFDRRTNVDLRQVGLLRRTLYQLENVSVRRTDGQTTIVSGEIAHPRTLPTPPSVSTHGRATVSLRITADGIVDRLAVGYDARRGEEIVRVRFATRVSAVDETTVTRPEWVDHANRTASRPPE